MIELSQHEELLFAQLLQYTQLIESLGAYHGVRYTVERWKGDSLYTKDLGYRRRFFLPSRLYDAWVAREHRTSNRLGPVKEPAQRLDAYVPDVH